MTNEEREALIAQGWTPPEPVDPDLAEAEKLWELWGHSKGNYLALKAIKRGRELERAVMGNPIPEQIQEVTPPEPVNPDLAEAEKIEREYWVTSGIHPLEDAFMKAIKRGRALAAEAKPGMVWKKWDGSEQCPVKLDDYVWSKGADGGVSINRAGDLDWMYVTHYAIITPPEEDAA